MKKILVFSTAQSLLVETQNGGDDRNVRVFADGEVDRFKPAREFRVGGYSTRNETTVNGGSKTIESILGTKFEASIVEEVDFGTFPGGNSKSERNRAYNRPKRMVNLSSR